MPKRTLTLTLFFALASISTLAQEAPKASYPQTRLFGVILLQGSNTPAKNDAELPPATVKVLEEVRSFLPYKYFHLLDSSFIRSDRDASFRLNGPDKKSYTATLRFHQNHEKPNVLMVSGFEIYEVVTTTEGEKTLRHRKNHIETSFSINVGETIVVGTSRVDSDADAVIVLLSAG